MSHSPTSPNEDLERRVGEIVGEFTQRLAAGEPTDPEDYVRRYPDIGDVLRPLLLSARVMHRGANAAAPAFLGDFLILGEVGRGGMGVVYEAVQESLGRHVALKVLPAQRLLSPTYLHRFRREAQAAARLHHTNIVPVFGVGEHEGAHFYAMQFIQGQGLDRLARAKPDFALIARLGAQAADALAYAHGQGVLHRDVKPSNLLLDPAGVVWLTDFGLAKAEGMEDLTGSGDLVGTLRYMAPEQLEGEAGPLSDVYSLGLTLYELLASRPAYDEADRGRLLQQVARAEPPPPRRLNPAVPRDLETIVLKCLAREPARRYASAAALADDLRRFQAGEPVRARRVPLWERALLWARRHPAWAGLALVSAVAAVLLALFGLRYTYSKELEQALTTAEKARGETRSALYLNSVLLAHSEWQNNSVPQARRLLEDCPSDLRRWEWHYLHRLSQVERFAVRELPFAVNCVAFSPDGERLATGSSQRSEGGRYRGQLLVRDARTGGKVLSLVGHASEIHCLAFSPDGRWLASGSHDHTIKVWDAATGREERTLRGHGGGVRGVAFAPDGRRLASASWDRTVRIWDAMSGQETLSFKGHTSYVQCVVFSPDGQRLASAGWDGTVRVWSAQTGQQVLSLRGQVGSVWGVAFSPQGERLYSIGENRVHVWNAQTGAELFAFLGQGALAVSPDGKHVATADRNGAIQVWDAVDCRLAVSLRGHGPDRINGLAFSRDGNRLASVGADRSLMVWDWERGHESRVLQAAQGLVVALAFSPDGKKLAWNSHDGKDQDRNWGLTLWDLPAGKEARRLRGHPQPVKRVAFNPNETLLASASEDWTVKVWEAETGLEVHCLRGHPAYVTSVAFSPDGMFLASGNGTPAMSPVMAPVEVECEVILWDPGTGQAVRSLRGHAGTIHDVAFSPNGSQLASGGQDKTVRIWDARTGQEVLRLNGHQGEVRSLAYSPDGRRLASLGYRVDEVSPSGEIKIWDATTGQETLSFSGQAGAISGLAFSPDGDRLATASGDSVRLWDATTGHAALTLRGHSGGVLRVVFSPDGFSLASGGSDHTVRLWDGTPLR